MSRQLIDLKICPRCGGRYSYIKRVRRGERTYLYAVHYHGYDENRRPKLSYCYLGPEDHYVYVTKTHAREGLVFRGAGDRDRLAEYLEDIIHAIEMAELEPQQLRSMARRLEEASSRLKKIADTLESQEEPRLVD